MTPREQCEGTLHTPGPWQISRDKRTIFASTNGMGALIRGIEQTIPQIAYICANGFGARFEEQDANARLIASAPDMLKALRAVRNDLSLSNGLHSLDADVEQAVEAAIAKAQGR